MKKIGVITLNGNYNFGNRLQNYAMIEVLKRYGNDVENIWLEEKDKYKAHALLKKNPITNKEKRFNVFCNFTHKYIKNINLESYKDINEEEYDYFVVGSDQVWNPTFPVFDSNSVFLNFSKERNKNIAYAASIGILDIPDEHINSFKTGLDSFKAISVREENAKRIVEEINGRKDSEILIDPTMLLSAKEWDKIADKPIGLDENEKFILTCFLGEFSEEHRNEINEIAKKNNWKVINLLDEQDPFHPSGPSEFLYLEKHAEVIFTDSFHSCVFAIIYNRPFIVYDRVSDKILPMNTRIDTLVKTFKFSDRRYEKCIKENHLIYDYSEVNEILEKERKKALDFIERALDIK